MSRAKQLLFDVLRLVLHVLAFLAVDASSSPVLYVSLPGIVDGQAVVDLVDDVEYKRYVLESKDVDEAVDDAHQQREYVDDDLPLPQSQIATVDHGSVAYLCQHREEPYQG